MEVKEIKKEKNTKTKELPLKVETEMIYSLLNGIKTQFRKPIKEGEAFLSKYKKNDILYVKEGWGFYYDKLIYRSDLSILRDTLSPEHYEDLMKKTNWKSYILMPRKFSRIHIKITKIRFERLNKISDKDIMAEGIDFYVIPDKGIFYQDYSYFRSKNSFKTPIESFKSLWDRTYITKDRFKWDKNPFVCVYEFKILNKNEIDL